MRLHFFLIRMAKCSFWFPELFDFAKIGAALENLEKQVYNSDSEQWTHRSSPCFHTLVQIYS